MAIRSRHVALIGAFVAAALGLVLGARRLYPSADADAVADEIWRVGDEDTVRKMLKAELDRLPESEGQRRARVFVRFGVVDTNPDGQAALFAQACVADPGVCDRDRLQQAAEREVRARRVPPGDHLPLYFIGHHPPMTGPK
jgi:hypothetical protein